MPSTNEKNSVVTGRLPVESVQVSTGLSAEMASDVADTALKSDNHLSCLVLVLDIRKSTTVMLHVENFTEYAKGLANFVHLVRLMANDGGVWFDKFTGDGTITFKPVKNPLEADKLIALVELAVQLQIQFLTKVLDIWRANALGAIPVGFGISAGIDFGKCLLSALTPTDDMKIDGKPVAQGHNSLPPQSVTILGRPVVGAVRMVSGAAPNRIVLNEGPGEFCYRLFKSGGLPNSMRVRQIQIQNKDFQGLQHAYEVSDDRIASVETKIFG